MYRVHSNAAAKVTSASAIYGVADVRGSGHEGVGRIEADARLPPCKDCGRNVSCKERTMLSPVF
jgi:hypothetical protein